MKNLYIILFFIFLVLPIVIAAPNTEYTAIGYNDFNLGEGNWDAEQDYQAFTRSLNDPRQAPLVADLDNDGTNEIIVLDGLTIRLYQGKTLSIVDAYTSAFDYSISVGGNQIITADIDDDAYIEIIRVSVDTPPGDDIVIEILEYNGTDFFEQHRFDIDISLDAQVRPIMACDESVERCLLAVGRRASGSNAEVAVWGFNSTVITGENVIQAVGDTWVYCPSKIKVMTVADYDNDGDNEFIFNFLQAGTGDEDIFMFYVGINETLNTTEELSFSKETFASSPTVNCYNDKSEDFFTSPLVFDIDGSISNGLETIVGWMVDADEFVMWSWDKNGNKIDDYPEFFEADGVIISNVMRVDAFSDTDDDDFCVMGYDTLDNEIDLLCASEQTGSIPETKEFHWTTPYDINTTYDSYYVMAHAAEQDYSSEWNNLDEIITTYGTFKISYEGVNHLERLFASPVDNGAFIGCDVEKTGNIDLLALTGTNLWYIDDEFTNQGCGDTACITEYYVNPALGITWEINNTGEIRMTLRDAESDTVAGKVIIDAENRTGNIQNLSWSGYVASGTTLSFNFDINDTITNGVIQLKARDSVNPTSIQTLEFAFTVAEEGIVPGEVVTDTTVIPDEELVVTDIDLEDNAIVNGIREIMSGFGLSELMIWLIIMAAVAAGLFMYMPASVSASATVAIVGIIETLFLIMGTLLGFISTGIIIVLVIVGLIGIGLYINAKITGTGT